MPPLPRRAMVPDRNCRQLNCPVPIAHRGGGSAEVDLKATFIHIRKRQKGVMAACHGSLYFLWVPVTFPGQPDKAAGDLQIFLSEELRQ